MLLERDAFAAPAVATTKAPRLRLVPAERLLRALRELSGSHGVVISHRETPWASITFSGARHTFLLRFDAPEAVAAGEDFIAALPEHEFRLPGHIVADASVTRADHTLLPAPVLDVECDILLLCED